MDPIAQKTAMETASLSTSSSASMFQKTLDVQQSSVEKLINAAPQLPTDVRNEQGIGTKIDTTI